MDWERLREKVLEEFYPTEDELEATREKYREVADFIEEEHGMETHFAGSASRGTCRKGDKDIDIFVLFPEDTDREELENRGLEIGKSVFKEFNDDYRIEYAEHPYTKGELNGHEVEIVPCYDVDPENIKSSVDRTPHHSRWVQENLSEDQRKDVVALKAFLEAQDLYGSSLKTEGFSGYLTEILIAHYGSFEALIREAVNWDEEEVIDPEDHHEKLPGELERKFSNDSLVVIDPVDPERNVASVLSRENYARFVFEAWRFRNDPGMDFFHEKEAEFTEFELKQEVERRGDFLVLEFENPEGVEDVVHPQMRKALSRIEDELEKRDFRIYSSGYHVGENTRVFLEMDRELPEIEEMKGPKVFHAGKHLAQFTGKYDNVFIRGDRLVAKIDREYSDAKQFLDDFLAGKLVEKGIPNRVAPVMADFSFVDPMEGGKEWLKYLAEKLHVEGEPR